VRSLNAQTRVGRHEPDRPGLQRWRASPLMQTKLFLYFDDNYTEYLTFSSIIASDRPRQRGGRDTSEPGRLQIHQNLLKCGVNERIKERLTPDRASETR